MKEQRSDGVVNCDGNDSEMSRVTQEVACGPKFSCGCGYPHRSSEYASKPALRLSSPAKEPMQATQDSFSLTCHLPGYLYPNCPFAEYQYSAVQLECGLLRAIICDTL